MALNTWPLIYQKKKREPEKTPLSRSFLVTRMGKISGGTSTGRKANHMDFPRGRWEEKGPNELSSKVGENLIKEEENS